MAYPPLTDYLTALKHFVHVEYDAQARQVKEMWEKSIPARVAEGEAISEIEILQVNWNRAVLRCQENLSKFREADTLILSRGNPMAGGYSCILDEENGNELVINPAYGVNFMQLGPGPGWVLDRYNVDVRHILINTLETITNNQEWGSYLWYLLNGHILPQINASRKLHASTKATKLGLNPSQAEAFANAYATENYYLIQGPPGTGKTWVLAHLAAGLAQNGERILVTAFTHRAINNALRKIVKATGYRDVIKVGQKNYADDLSSESTSIPNYEKLEYSPYSPASQGIIIGGTCFAVRTNRLREIQFDTIIFDEASQVTLPLAFAGMLSARKFIFIGDHKQMSPVITGVHDEKWVTCSIFETLFHIAPGTMLDTTYRMCAEINAFPSQRFYDNRLKPSKNAGNNRLKLVRKPIQFQKLLDPDKPEVFAEISHSGRGMRSPEEADLAANIVLEALACGVNPKEIAVVAPYRAQCRMIKHKIREYAIASNQKNFEDIVVDTVERIQGQERDIVIISLTTSDPTHAAQRAEFYFQPNRLNVAITRPRVKRIVIGSINLFDARPLDPKLQEWVDNFRALYHQSYVVRVNN